MKNPIDMSDEELTEELAEINEWLCVAGGFSVRQELKRDKETIEAEQSRRAVRRSTTTTTED